MSHETPDRARQLAHDLELRFAQDAELARRLNDAHDRLQRANDRLWCGIHPDGIGAVYGERPTEGNAAFGENRSEVLGAPDQRQALQRIHWQIHKAHCDYLVDLDLLTPAERRDLAIALLPGASEETRALLLDSFTTTDAAAIGQARR